MLRYSIDGMKILDGRAIRASMTGQQMVAHSFWPTMKETRNAERFRQTLRCEPDALDEIVKIIEPE
jgi:hypothetical protein